MVEMALKMVKGYSVDIQLDPNKVERSLRGDLGYKFLSLQLAKNIALLAFWMTFLSAFAFIALTLFMDKLLLIPAFIAGMYSLKFHFKYLQAWSTWNKYSRKWVARIDLDKESSLYGVPQVPWVKLRQGH